MTAEGTVGAPTCYSEKDEADQILAWKLCPVFSSRFFLFFSLKQLGQDVNN
jgi:hypothetical protein